MSKTLALSQNIHSSLFHWFFRNFQSLAYTVSQHLFWIHLFGIIVCSNSDQRPEVCTYGPSACGN